jgi:hypothetical protein
LRPFFPPRYNCIVVLKVKRIEKRNQALAVRDFLAPRKLGKAG